MIWAGIDAIVHALVPLMEFQMVTVFCCKIDHTDDVVGFMVTYAHTDH